MIRSIVRRVLEKRGLELRREPSLCAFLEARHVDLVMDVGANEGQFAQRLRAGGYCGHILSVEPIAAVHARLAEWAKTDPNWTTAHTALGAETGEATIHVAKDTAYSSILISGEGIEAAHPGIAAVREETVGVTTLDALVAGHPAENPFIKIDVQGFEREVLAGGPKTLARAVGLQMEVGAVQLYDGGWSMHEAIAHLDTLGFVPAQFRSVWPDPAHPASAGEFDVVFRRKDT